MAIRSHIMLAALAALAALAGCAGADDGPAPLPGPDGPATDGATAIAIAPGAVGAGAAAGSRGTSMEAPSQLQGQTLGVSAYQCDLNGDAWTMADLPVFGNQQVHVDPYDYSKCTYSPVKYWPQKEYKLQFFSWWPHSDSYATPVGIDVDLNDAAATSLVPYLRPSGDGDGDDAAGYELRMPFAVKADATEQADVLVAEPSEPVNNAYSYPAANPLDFANATRADTPSPVALAYRHALARVRFRVQFPKTADNASYTVKVRSLTLFAISEGVVACKSKNYTYAKPNGDGTYARTTEAHFPAWETDRIVEYSEPDPDTGIITVLSTPANGRWSFTPGDGLPEDTAGSGTLTLTPGGSQATATTHDLFMIPQRPPKFDTFRPTQLVMPILNITYRLDNGLTGDDWLYTDKNVSFSLADVLCENMLGSSYTTEVINATDEASVPYVWLPGQSYLYTISITTTDVTLNIYPTDWYDGNAGNTDYIFY